MKICIEKLGFVKVGFPHLLDEIAPFLGGDAAIIDDGCHSLRSLLSLLTRSEAVA